MTTLDIKLRLNFSAEDEVERIKYTLGRLGWFREQKYKINLPSGIEEILKHGKRPTDQEIANAVSNEFARQDYKEKVDELEMGWEKDGNSFLESLATLGLPIQHEYEVLFTKYGVGGSYGLPNFIQININYPNARDVLSTVFHEVIHLTIENLIKEYKIDHWTKERLVDLIFGRFFPTKQRLQRNPNEFEKVSEIFNKFFPDIKTIIKELGTPLL